MKSPAEDIETLAKLFGLSLDGNLPVVSPIDGRSAGLVVETTHEDATAKIELANSAFLHWRKVPAPRRGELVRLFGQLLREHKEPLAQLVTLECGKPMSDGLGEVQ